MPSSPETQPVVARPRATVLGAFLEGWRRAIRAPWVTAGILLVTIVASLPLALVLRDEIATDLGTSTASDRVVRGWDSDWAAEFADRSGSLGRTLTHEILGFGGTLATLDRILEGEPLPLALSGAVGTSMLVWIFLAGGLVDRMARARPLGSTFFLATCGRFFLRNLRLSAFVALLYGVVIFVVHPLLFGAVFDMASRNSSSETQALVHRAGLYAVFLVLLAAVSLFSDFTRVRLVVEDRRSVLSAAGSSLRFVRRRFWRCAGLYAINILGQVVLARLWLQVAPEAGAADWTVLLVTEIYLVSRIWARVAFIASDVVFFQGELAHATYTATPLTRWPDSASVEAVRALAAR